MEDGVHQASPAPRRAPAEAVARALPPAPRPGLRQRAARVLRAGGLLPGLLMLRSLHRRDLRVLAYHRVLPGAVAQAFEFDPELVSATAEQFRAQMALLRRRFHPLRFREVIDAIDHGRRLPPRAVVVTFDDGYDDNYRVAFPILRELGLPATFFVSTGHIDSGRAYAYDWLVHMIRGVHAARLQVAELRLDRAFPDTRDGRLALAAELLDRMKALDAPTQAAIIQRLEREWSMPRAAGHADCRPMGWDQLREMHAAGMEIGSHGVWHHMLAKLPREEMRQEVTGSKQTLERELGAPCEVISYPVGGCDAYDDEVLRAVRDAGYRLGCSYLSGTNPLPLDEPFGLRRLAVERHMDLSWFAAQTSLPEIFSYPSRQRTTG
jgi:peptidoglycan/xylan/chitin deacetylase (PgdA/CDA1 family)